MKSSIKRLTEAVRAAERELEATQTNQLNKLGNVGITVQVRFRSSGLGRVKP
jgi:hypothetical protein